MEVWPFLFLFLFFLATLSSKSPSRKKMFGESHYSSVNFILSFISDRKWLNLKMFGYPLSLVPF